MLATHVRHIEATSSPYIWIPTPFQASSKTSATGLRVVLFLLRHISPDSYSANATVLYMCV